MMTMILMETPLGRDIIQATMMYVHLVTHIFCSHPDTITQNHMHTDTTLASEAIASVVPDAMRANALEASADTQDEPVVVEHSKQPVSALPLQVSKDMIKSCEQYIENC
jgi:hypothetical protein